jgi:hypothetical protein
MDGMATGGLLLVDKLVVRRMKNQGMSWSLQGIRRPLSVRFLVPEGKLTGWLKRSHLVRLESQQRK